MANATSQPWLAPGGKPVACVEKVKVLEDNLRELVETAQDALDDAVLLGVDPEHARQRMAQAITALRSDYATL